MTTLRKTYRDGRWGQVHLRLAIPDIAPNPPLLLLHQTPKSGWIWEPLFPFLADRPLIAPDTPGYGASDAPSAPVEIDELADEMAALVIAMAADGLLPAGRVDVMGYHTGSVTALALARRYPALVRRVICTSLPFYTAEERAAKLAALPDHPAIAKDGAHLLHQWQAIAGFTDARASLAWRQASLTENLRAGPTQFSGYRAVYRHDLQAELARLSHPLLLLNPGDDLFEQTRRARALVPACSYLERPDLAHGLFEIAPAMIASALRGFLGEPAAVHATYAEQRT